MSANLQVFIERECRACERALHLAGEVGERFPELAVEVVDLSQPGVAPPDHVFAVPTFVLNGRILSLGNPRGSGLLAAVEAALRIAGGRGGETGDGR